MKAWNLWANFWLSPRIEKRKKYKTAINTNISESNISERSPIMSAPEAPLMMHPKRAS